MSHETIIVETKGKVGIIRLNRPQALNALNAQVNDELTAAIDAFEADDSIGCVILTGSEKAFAAGADIKEMAAKSHMDVFKERLRGELGSRRAHAQAGDRGGRGLRARRRLRARDDVRHHHRGRQCEVRPAGDQARRHSGDRRHAAADPRGRQGEGDGPEPDRPHDGCGGSRALRAGGARGAGREPDGRGDEGGRDHRRRCR